MKYFFKGLFRFIVKLPTFLILVGIFYILTVFSIIEEIIFGKDLQETLFYKFLEKYGTWTF